jgi:hypothetical protein
MSDRAEHLKQELAKLSLEERDEIRDYLESLEEDMTQEEWDEHLLKLANLRLTDFEAGRTKDTPWEEVDRRMREKYG